MTSKAPKSLASFVDEKDAARFIENQDIQRSARAARAVAAEQSEELDKVRKRLALYETLDAEKLAPPTWLAPKKAAGKHAAIPTLLLTDIHYDEVVKPEQIGGVNAYGRAIADRRIRRAFEGAVTMSRDYLSGSSTRG